VHADADGHPMIVPLPQPAEPPAVAAAPRPGRVAVATQVPPRHVSEKPTDIRQMMPLLAPALAPPLRDAALCRGPDGTWYLIGTEGAQADDGTIDWSRNNGVHLWSSADRTSWTDAGLVWDIDRDATRSPASAWQLATHLDTTCGARTVVGSAVTAPEMRYLKGTFWIVYSMNGSGIGLLKSTSGKAEGPYADLGRIVAHGRDGSLFEEDGRVSLVWGAGYHARLSDDLTHLDGPVCALFTQVRWYPRQMRRPELMGLWGSHLVKQGDWYVWTFTTRTGRMGINAIDTCASWSTSLDGPWGEPCLMLPHGGQSTLVSDGTQGWLATVSGEDTASACPFQAAITPVVSGEGKAGSPLRCAAYGAQATVSQFATVHALQATELDLWIGYPDLLGTEERDVFVTRFGEDYYTTGTLWGDGGKYETTINLFTSRDLMHWTCIPDLYRIERIIDDGILQGAELERFRKAIAPDPARKRFQNPRVAEQKVYKAGDHYYITFQIIGSGLSAVLIKSAGSDIRGPYRAIQSIPGTMDMMVQDDGSVLYSCGGKIRRFGNLAEFERTRGPRGYFDTNTSAISNTELPNANFTEDCETGIERIAGKYVTWSTDWTGSYDGIYQFADDPQGPWRGAMRVIPHGGNGRFFQHRDGSWWYGAFVLNSNDWSTEAVDGVRFLPIPIDVTQVDRELVIEPKAMRANRARIDRMGALWHRPTPAGQVLR
jgi:hypothetical protein